jgi:uncharacterized ion transporter superfamily protein YfcC|tara:strand:- start:394 stop:642 length:249 start_codon:yes stop_codon:yes gene_type:complete
MAKKKDNYSTYLIFSIIAIIVVLFLLTSFIPTGKFTGNLDPDEDGLSNYFESIFGTNPNYYDTDGDGVSDGQEVADHTDPLN